MSDIYTDTEITIAKALENALRRLKEEAGTCTESDDLELAISRLKRHCGAFLEREL